MSYRVPTSRHKRKKQEGLNLIPILDAVFIFIFFLLMSAQFIKIFEIGSDIPIMSSEPPPKNQKKPLALTVEIKKSGFVISKGVPSVVIKSIRKTPEGKFNLPALHDYLVGIKKSYVNEETIVLEPKVDITYEEVVKIMDTVRLLNNTDDKLYRKDKDGIDVEIKTLFSKIMFGNLMS